MTTQCKNIVLLGATGSIGETTLKVIDNHKNKLKLIGISGHHNVEKLAHIARNFHVQNISITDSLAYKLAKDQSLFGSSASLFEGPQSLQFLATLPEADIIVIATVGTHGLLPTIAALKAKKTIALANKEVLVMAGEWIMPLAHANQTPILPLDSEHNALFQCLRDENHHSIDQLILTASGGPFLNIKTTDLNNVTPEMALKHPNWQMGAKVTIDCATMANKGLELIEAHWLFNIPPEKLKVTIHPESIVHSLISFIDGSTLGHFSPPNMMYAIQNSLLYPDRYDCPLKPLDFSQPITLHFSPPNLEQFPCLKLAQIALISGNSYPTVFNAANEIAVEAFIQKRIPFTKIPEIIEKTLNDSYPKITDLNGVLDIDHTARQIAHHHLTTL